jgi:hypothetical protein
MEVAGAPNRRWRWPFRYRGSRHESAVAQLFSLGHSTTFMKTIAVIIFAVFGMLAHAADKLFDDELAKNAVAVLRVHSFATLTTPSNTFTWYHVRVYQVFKNESDENLMHDFPVGALRGRDGVPSGDCTIYLERYDVPNHVFIKSKTYGSWVLVGGDATNGVSHIDGKAVLR